MMNTMRSFASGFVAKLLLLFLVLTFAVWGIGDILRSNGTNYAAKVGSETISLSEFGQQRAFVSRQLEAMGVKNIAPNALDNHILQQLVQQKLVLLSLHDLGLYVNDDLLTKTLRAEPAFQGKDGSFSSETFRAIAHNQNLSERAMLNHVRDQAGGQFLVASLDMSDVTPPTSVRNLLTAAELETRDAWILTIQPQAAASAPSEADLKSFYDQNKSVLYVQPETRTLDYATISPADITALIDKSITPQMLADQKKLQPKASDAALRETLRSQQRDAAMHSLQASLDDALAGGQNFEEALKKAGIHSSMRHLNNATQTAAKTSGDEVEHTVTEQGFTLSEGETSGLLSTPHGTLVIVHVTAIQPSAPQPYEKVAADVKAHVSDQQRRDATRQQVVKLRSAITALSGEGKPAPTDKQYQELFRQFHLTPRRVSGISRPTPTDKTVNGLPVSLVQAIFERQVGNVAGPLALDNGGQMLAIVTANHHPAPETLKEKSGAAQEQHLKELSAGLNQSVQNQTLTSLLKRYPVVVNQKLGAATSDTGGE